MRNEQESVSKALIWFPQYVFNCFWRCVLSFATTFISLGLGRCLAKLGGSIGRMIMFSVYGTRAVNGELGLRLLSCLNECFFRLVLCPHCQCLFSYVQRLGQFCGQLSGVQFLILVLWLFVAGLQLRYRFVLVLLNVGLHF